MENRKQDPDGGQLADLVEIDMSVALTDIERIGDRLRSAGDAVVNPPEPDHRLALQALFAAGDRMHAAARHIRRARALMAHGDRAAYAKTPEGSAAGLVVRVRNDDDDRIDALIERVRALEEGAVTPAGVPVSHTFDNRLTALKSAVERYSERLNELNTRIAVLEAPEQPAACAPEPRPTDPVLLDRLEAMGASLDALRQQINELSMRAAGTES